MPTFMKGYRGKGLNEEDLYETLTEDKAQTLGDNAEKLWKEALRKSKHSGKKPSILLTMLKLVRFSFIAMGLEYVILELVLRPLQILLLGWIIYSVGADKDHLALFVALFLINTLAIAFICQGAYTFAYHTGMKVRVAVCCLVYRKALKLSQSAFGETTAGQMINLLANDVNVYDRFIIIFHYSWVTPAQLIIFIYLMYLEVGVASFVGVFILTLTVPFHAYLGKLSGKYRSRIAQRTDVRIRLMDEIVRGIEIIKMYAWEKSFAKIIAQARRNEIKVVTFSSYLKGTTLFYFIYISVPLFITIICYVLFGNYIDARKVFLVGAYYNNLGFNMATAFPQASSLIGEALASSNRILKFLILDEVKLKNEMHEGSEYAIELKAATAKWNITSAENTLSNLTVNIKSGSLVAVIGSVGSGKSSLLQCLLKELQLNSGSMNCNGTVSYAGQEAWIFTSSMRQNILFGSKLDENRYKTVVSVCALTTDFNLFPFGDRTVVGERGASLSGGQRARINLARAIYKDADIYLLDDPLSAVDTHVSRHIFEECILKHLHNKTVILVTHQLQYLHQVDHIINLENGCIKIQGSYDEIKDKLHIDLVDEQDTPKEGRKNRDKAATEETTKPEDGPKGIKEQTGSESETSAAFKNYLLASKNYYAIFFSVILFILIQITLSGSFFLMTHWVNFEKSLSSEVQIEESKSRYLYIYIYIAITTAIILLILLRNTICYNICMNSSMNLHNAMFDSVVHASMYFFNTNSSGRILNRFSKDMGQIDELVPTTIIITTQTLFGIIGVMVVTSVVNAWILIPSAVIAVLFYYLRVFYLMSSLSIKRLEGTTRSPIFGHLNATLQGLTTIRALNAQHIVQTEFDNKQDLHSCCYHLFGCTSRSFGFGLDLICFIYLSFISIIIFAISNEDGGRVGLVISQVLQLMGQLQWGMRQSTELENYMTSVERVLEYNDIEHERQFESTLDKKPLSSWPQDGKLVFDKVSLRYVATDPPVLNDLTFTIKPKQKIGIVGRTGAGKSSLIAAIFQLSNTEGKILLDDINIQEIGLHDLRKEISIIPQNPIVFAGSIRKNLDPFEEYSDETLWKALEAVKLKGTVEMLDAGLNSRILDGGSNLSVGQRQLICLARAILRDNKVLILDEATANVDPETDALIQKTLRETFVNCTVLTVAHRLNTIMDSDKVLVMDAGRLMEFDHPYLLLQQKGIFYGMVQETDKAMASALTKIAKDKYEEIDHLLQI